jgi:hypothetical protein
VDHYRPVAKRIRRQAAVCHASNLKHAIEET